MNDQEVRAVADKVNDCINLKTVTMGVEFYPAHLSVALIDAMFSVRSKYDSHVVPVVKRYCRHFRLDRERPKESSVEIPLRSQQETLEGLVGHYDDYGNDRMREEIFRSSSKSPGTEIHKSDNILKAAKELLKIGINDLQDAASREPHEIKCSLLPIRGIGLATAHMFLMYTGKEDFVKGDVHVCNFVAECLGFPPKKISPREAERIVRAAAGVLEVRPRFLDYAIWKFGSDS